MLSHKVAKPNITFILENASLKCALVGKKQQILNSEEHADFLRRKKLDPYSYRSDIVHDALRQITTSRLRMVGRIQDVYVRTDEGVLIKIDPNTNIPKNLGKFCSMMSQLLQNFKIKASSKQKNLLRLVKNPVTQYLPTDFHKIGLSFSSEKVIELNDYVKPISDDVNLVFVVGAMAHGKLEANTQMILYQFLAFLSVLHVVCGRYAQH